MSKTALAIALVLLIGLAGAGIILLTKPAPPSSGPIQLLPTLPPEQVASLTIEGETYTREGETWRTPTGWPARTERVRALIRALSGLEGEAAVGEMTDALSIIILMEDGTEHALSIDRSAFAGSALAASGGVSAEVNAVITERLPKADHEWYIRSAMPGLDPMRVNRVEISSPEQTFVAMRRDTGWFVELEPSVFARASETSIRALVGRFRTIEVVRFEGPRNYEPGSFDFFATFWDAGEPEARRSIGLTFEPAGAQRDRLATITLEVPNADARVDETGLVTGIDPAEIPLDPIAYAARNASKEIATNVRTITVGVGDTERQYTRTLDGFRDPSGADVDRDAKALLVAMIENQGVPGYADTVALRFTDRVQLLGDDGGLLQEFEAGYTPEGVFALRSGPVVWAYPRATPPALLRFPPPIVE